LPGVLKCLLAGLAMLREYFTEDTARAVVSGADTPVPRI